MSSNNKLNDNLIIYYYLRIGFYIIFIISTRWCFEKINSFYINPLSHPTDKKTSVQFKSSFDR